MATVLLGGCGHGAPADRTAAPTGPAAVPTVLIVDASGSMTEADAPGPRIDAARRAAQGLVDGMPDGARMGLVTYGTGTGSSDAEQEAGCRDVKVLIPLGSLDRAQMATQISGLAASGYTPISVALDTAVAQFPAGSEPQAIVLVSDGEDTCGTPPCDTARAAKPAHPNLAISTVGFKTEGAASEQLGCIAAVTGGVFVQAANASQLAARLLIAQNVDEANKMLSGTGLGDIALGSTAAAIRAQHPDFPEVSGSGSVRVVYVDCDYTFVDGVLDSIAPHEGGRTIDGVGPGTPLSRVTELYGDPVATETDGKGGYRLTYSADSGTDAGYRFVVENYKGSGGALSGTVKTVVLCRCAPKAAPVSGAGTETVVLKPVDVHGNVTAGWLKDTTRSRSEVDCTHGGASPYAVTGGVWACPPTSAAADACWPTAAGNYVLCLVDPFSRTLSMYSAPGTASPEPSTGAPIPMALELDDGTRCRATWGGSWGKRGGPVYACEGEQGIWRAPGRPDGIERRTDGWVVDVGSDSGPTDTPHRVKTAYFVGMG